MHITLHDVTVIQLLRGLFVLAVLGLLWALDRAVTAAVRRRRRRADPGQHDGPLAGADHARSAGPGDQGHADPDGYDVSLAWLTSPHRTHGADRRRES